MCALLIPMSALIDRYTLCPLFCIFEGDKGAGHCVPPHLITDYPHIPQFLHVLGHFFAVCHQLLFKIMF